MCCDEREYHRCSWFSFLLSVEKEVITVGGTKDKASVSCSQLVQPG